MKRLIIKESQLKVIKDYILETIDPEEAYTKSNSLQTVIDGRRNIGFIGTLYDKLEDYIDIIQKAGLKIIKVKQPNDKEAIIFYRDGYGEDAERLNKIARRNNGYLPINTPEETYEIGILLGYHPEKVKEFVLQKFKDFKFTKKIDIYK